jgi:ELWxxDGT repeat protein
VKDIRSGPIGSRPGSLAEVDGVLFFAADDGAKGSELWKSDGSESGTVRVKDIAPGQDSSVPDGLREVDGRLVFRACDALGCEVWTSDGTEAGTRRVADVEPGAVGSNPAVFTPSGARIFFVAQTAETGSELWTIPRSALFDADGDGVTDSADNCLEIENADQADLDGDGAGDRCDVDRDGDGVANASDLCPASPADERVSAEGCTAEELVALRCPRESFPSRGRHVSCVANAAGEARDAGLIGGREKAGFVKRAARAR